MGSDLLEIYWEAFHCNRHLSNAIEPAMHKQSHQRMCLMSSCGLRSKSKCYALDWHSKAICSFEFKAIRRTIGKVVFLFSFSFWFPPQCLISGCLPSKAIQNLLDDLAYGKSSACAMHHMMNLAKKSQIESRCDEQIVISTGRLIITFPLWFCQNSCQILYWLTVLLKHTILTEKKTYT